MLIYCPRHNKVYVDPLDTACDCPEVEPVKTIKDTLALRKIYLAKQKIGNKRKRR